MNKSNLITAACIIALCAGVFYLAGAQKDYFINKRATSFKNTEAELLSAAEKGYANAQYHLALKYDYGRDIPEDDAKGCYWYKQAAEQGHHKAQNNYGVCLKDGKGGLKRNFPLAMRYFEKASEQGHKFAKSNLADMYQDLGRFEEAHKLYIEALPVVDNPYFNHDDRMYAELGWNYFNGHGVEKNYKEAYKYFMKAAELENADAYYFLGRMYEEGWGVEKNKEKAFEYFLKGLNKNGKKATLHLAHAIYREEYDVTEERAFEFYRKAALLRGDINSVLLIHHHYCHGLGVAKDLKEARAWYRVAKKYGSDGAISRRLAQLELKKCGDTEFSNIEKSIIDAKAESYWNKIQKNLAKESGWLDKHINNELGQ